MSYRLVLWAIGVLLASASRMSTRVQGQLGCDLVFAIETGDGVARYYKVTGRRLSSNPGLPAEADCTPWFRTAGLGTRTLLAPDTITPIIDG